MSNEKEETHRQRIERMKAEGYPVIAPNGLPLICIRNDGALLEHEDADYVGYKFPITVDYVGCDPDIDAASDGQGNTIHLGEICKHESHAMLWTDGWVILTIYEASFYLFKIDGECIAAHGCYEQKDWRINEASLMKICRWCINHPLETPLFPLHPKYPAKE